MRSTLNWILSETGWKQERLAAELDVTQATVSRWFAGSDPRGANRDKVRSLEQKLRGDDTSAAIDLASKVVRAPVISWVSASKLVVPDAVLDEDDAPTAYAMGLDQRGDWIALRVDGTSMDRISPPDSIIFVNRKDRMLVPNACYVVTTEDGEASYKRYRPNPDRWEPVSTLEHPTLYADQGLSLKIIGRVRMTTLLM